MDNNKVFTGLILVFSLVSIYYFNTNFSWLGILFWGLLVTAATYGYYFYVLRKRKQIKNNLEKSILDKISIGIVAIDSKGDIIWYNPKFKEIISKKGFLAGKLNQYLPNLQFKKHSQFQEILTQQIAIKDKIYQIKVSPLKENLRVVFLNDITEQTIFIQKTQTKKPVIGIIQIDNYSEVLETIEEDIRPLLFAELDKLISDWALERDAYIRKFADDKYLVFLTEEALKKDEESKFQILDKVRSMDFGKIPVTISIGFGIWEDSLIELGRLAHLSLELALGRGGDQVVVKSPEKVWFYGGKSQALEKRTKVKARVVAHTLKKMILDAENVIIMGHEGSDYDSLGSSLGLASAIRNMGKIPYIVVEQRNESLDKILTVLDKSKFAGIFIRPADIRRIEVENSLLIIVDTHKPSMVVEQNLLNLINKIVVIDHHRRSEEFIDNASLVYLESYASSTSELVTELIQYLGDEVEIDSWAATALLAGITVDTKSFVFQTGVRTFEAASYLRRIGADPVLVRKLLRDDLAKVTQKAVIIENSQIIKDHIALGYYPQPVDNAQVLAAQGADMLLNVDGINTSFVLCPLYEGGVTISARSTGETNVQFLMEKLGGGGHLTVAGVQLKDKSLEEAIEILIQLIDENY
ncbi:MAG: cyclic-di-AMP phosphodiesterase [Clostridia bacterium]|jgi:c-di-AMP phosphodiesterase-like protein|nr:cyclic-di-AMP phosphodiesterase [Clostridia bacterium]